MRNIRLLYILIAIFIFIEGCANEQLPTFINKDNLENKGLLNYALSSNGAKVAVSEDNPKHTASTLINGITSSDNWDNGEGWEFKYDNVPMINYDQQDSTNLYAPAETNDSLSYGIRVQASNGLSAPLGWVTIDLPEEKTVNRMVVYTIDSEKYPAEKFGVSFLVLQYWAEASEESDVIGWKVVDRRVTGGLTGNVIRNNKSGVISIRFLPVKTKRMRLAIWWTNDGKLHSDKSITGAIRIVEVELYGYESDKLQKTKTMSSNYEDIAEIEVVLSTYIDGCDKRDINLLMSCISPEYSKDGETFSGLQKRMTSTFAEHKQINLKLQDINVKLADTGADATVTANYESSIDNSNNADSSGIVTFNFCKKTGFWKIIRIDK